MTTYYASGITLLLLTFPLLSPGNWVEYKESKIMELNNLVVSALALL